MSNLEPAVASATVPPVLNGSPVESDRVRALAQRALEGAPALTPGEVRELAKAVIEHQAIAANP